MKIDKEYPATHSMSTSWYIVDEDGNVGIMDYNENGPVPWGVEQTSGMELKYGHWEDWQSRKLIRFNLTEEQILDLLHEPHAPSEEKGWYDCAVKIDKEKKSRFLELCKNKDIDKNDLFCISDELDLYEFDAYDCAHDGQYNETTIHGTLKTMLDENLILSVYKIQSLDMDDQYDDGKIVHNKEFDNSPYFMFHQPYWTDFLPQKMHEPLHPVKIEQIPDSFRHRLHKIPGKFKEMETFQISQYHPCNAYSNGDPTYVIDGCSYQTSPLPDGSKVYTQIYAFDYPFLPFCSERTRFNCQTKCSSLCCDIGALLQTDKPTVLLIFDPKEGYDYQWKVLSDIVLQKSYATSYIPRFPYRTGQQHFCLKHDVEKYMTDEYLSRVLKGSKGYIETIIDDINPRVILVADKAYRTISGVYSINQNKVGINGVDFPIYKLSSLKDKKNEIEELAKLGYQGKEHPHIITLEEMDKLVKMGVAKEYKDIL